MACELLRRQLDGTLRSLDAIDQRTVRQGLQGNLPGQARMFVVERVWFGSFCVWNETAKGEARREQKRVHTSAI